MAIQQRCTNPKNKSYNRYGGRGIKNFLTLNEMKDLWVRDNASAMKVASIDRIDNDGDYVFSNCQFIEKAENSRKARATDKRRKHRWTTNH